MPVPTGRVKVERREGTEYLRNGTRVRARYQRPGDGGRDTWRPGTVVKLVGHTLGDGQPIYHVKLDRGWGHLRGNRLVYTYWASELEETG